MRKSFSLSGFGCLVVLWLVTVPPAGLLISWLEIQTKQKKTLLFGAEEKLTDKDCWPRVYFTELRNNSCLQSKPYLDVNSVWLFRLLTLWQCEIKLENVLPVLGRGQRLGWCCQVCWEAQRCCSCTCSTVWSPFHQGCWTASSSPSQSCLQQSVNIIKTEKKDYIHVIHIIWFKTDTARTLLMLTWILETSFFWLITTAKDPKK